MVPEFEQAVFGTDTGHITPHLVETQFGYHIIKVIDRKKGYFPVPQLKYIAGPYLDMLRDALSSKAARERGLFRQDYIDRLVADPASHITPLQGSELWQIGLLEMWLQAQEN